MSQETIRKTSDKMKGAIEHLQTELANVRSGRASLALLDGIRVENYGTSTPLGQVASLSIPESRLMMVSPWDITLIPAIEKAIQSSGQGLTPNNDGKVIRIALPPLTEDRRKDLVRLVKKMGEDSRVIIRNHRRDANEELKKLEKTEGLSKDDTRKSQDEVQKLTDKCVQSVDQTLKDKEGEILER